MAPAYLTLTPEEEAEARRRLISQARGRRMAELRALDRERSRELVGRYRAATRANALAARAHTEEELLVARRNEARRQLREAEAQLREADAADGAAAARARAARAAAEERARRERSERSSARRATEALELLRRRQAEERCARDAEKARKDYCHHVEELRARRAALASRARDAERELALRREEEARTPPRVAPRDYTYVEVTADAYTPLMVNRAKSAARTAFSVERDEAGPSAAPGDAYLAAEAQRHDAAARAREQGQRDAARRERVRREQLATIDAVQEERLAEQALEILAQLQGK